MTWVVKHRGAPATTTARADYYCEVHGRFEAEVQRDANGDAPDSIVCSIEHGCELRAVWCVSAPVTRVRKFEAVKGKSDKPPTKYYTDTSAIGEGQPLYEWREDREKVWEQKRQEDVMRFAREVHERPIGGD